MREFKIESIETKMKVIGKLVANQNTVLKRSTLSSSELGTDEKVEVPKGVSIEVLAYAKPNKRHQEFTLNGKLKGKTNWFAFSDHFGYEELKHPPMKDKPVKAAVLDTHTKSTAFAKLPGITKPVGNNQSVYEGSAFTWGEMTKELTRLPINSAITQNIIKIAKELDYIRGYLGDNPIHITSGYRDPFTNRAIGGATASRHLVGDAVDFYIEGVDLVDAFYKLKSICPTGGLAVGSGFIHRDLREGPFPARWLYSGGPEVALW